MNELREKIADYIEFLEKLIDSGVLSIGQIQLTNNLIKDLALLHQPVITGIGEEEIEKIITYAYENWSSDDYTPKKLAHALSSRLPKVEKCKIPDCECGGEAIISKPPVEKVEELAKAIELILPLAKGYVACHQVGSNQDYISFAEGILNDLREKR